MTVEVLGAASTDIADGFGCNAAAVVVDIDSCYFRYFRCHPCTMAIAVVGD